MNPFLIQYYQALEIQYRNQYLSSLFSQMPVYQSNIFQQNLFSYHNYQRPTEIATNIALP
jgi:hypothetical protein